MTMATFTEPTAGTKAYQRLQADKHAALRKFVRAKAGSSKAKIKAAIRRAAQKGAV